jgi:hypothetical protein
MVTSKVISVDCGVTVTTNPFSGKVGLPDGPLETLRVRNFQEFPAAAPGQGVAVMASPGPCRHTLVPITSEPVTVTQPSQMVGLVS